MFVLVTYDVSTLSPAGRKRLRRVAQTCLNYGLRVQNSVFECQIDSTQLLELKRQLTKVIDPQEDSIRFYILGKNYRSNVEHFGTQAVPDISEPLVL